MEGLTDSEGKFEYVTDGCGHYILTSTHDSYVNYTKEMCLSKQSSTEISVPAIPLVTTEEENAQEKTMIQVMLSSDAGIRGLSMCCYCPFSNANNVQQK